MYLQNKSIPMVIILSLVTCGIYYYIWIYQTSAEVNNSLGETKDSAGIEVLLTIITCGIYGIYWFYKYCQRLNALAVKMSVQSDDNSIICLILPIVGLTVVSIGLMQHQINQLVEQSGATPPPPAYQA